MGKQQRMEREWGGTKGTNPYYKANSTSDLGYLSVSFGQWLGDKKCFDRQLPIFSYHPGGADSKNFCDHHRELSALYFIPMIPQVLSLSHFWEPSVTNQNLPTAEPDCLEPDLFG